MTFCIRAYNGYHVTNWYIVVADTLADAIDLIRRRHHTSFKCESADLCEIVSLQYDGIAELHTAELEEIEE